MCDPSTSMNEKPSKKFYLQIAPLFTSDAFAFDQLFVYSHHPIHDRTN